MAFRDRLAERSKELAAKEPGRLRGRAEAGLFEPGAPRMVLGALRD